MANTIRIYCILLELISKVSFKALNFAKKYSKQTAV